MKDIIQLLRPKQYIKNLFIFAPLFFTFSYNDYYKIILTLLSFLVFSITASSIYILNDIFDIKEDINHPKKKYRPIASGKISIKTGVIVSIILTLTSIISSIYINKFFTVIIILYIFINILYSIKLKHISILDIIIIAFGFLLRVIAGSIVGEISLSMWLIIMTFLLSVFLGFAKRRDDVILSLKGIETRKNIDGYNLEFINSAMLLMSSVTVVAYIFYTISPEVEAKFNSKYLYITAFFVIIGILRYMQITFVNENSGNPTDLFYKDKFLQVVIALWLTSFIIAVKFFNTLLV